MLHTFDFKSQFVLSKRFLLLNSVVETNAFLRNTNCAPKFPSFHSSLTFSRQIRILKPITYAKKSKRRSGFHASRKFMLQLITILASNLHILPQPLDFVIEGFNAGDGGGLGFLKRFGGGTFGWRKRRKTGNLHFLVILGILGFLFLLFGMDLKTNVFCGVLGLGSFGVVLVRGFKRNVKDWIFGLCCFGALIGLGWKTEAIKWVDEFRNCSPVVEILGRGKRKGRRAFSNAVR